MIPVVNHARYLVTYTVLISGMATSSGLACWAKRMFELVGGLRSVDLMETDEGYTIMAEVEAYDARAACIQVLDASAKARPMELVEITQAIGNVEVNPILLHAGEASHHHDSASPYSTPDSSA